jgi:FkbM family methyltransferase
MLASRNQHVLDLGGHIGTFSLLAARLGYQVIAMEASPRNATLLQASAAHNHFDQLKVIQRAVSDRVETLKFVQAGPYGLVSTPFHTDPTITVEATTVDAALAENGWDRVDFVKMDVEGSEVKAVAGMSKLLARSDAPPILYESNGHTLNYFGETPNSLMAALEAFGYHCYLVEPGQLVPLRSTDIQTRCTIDILATKTPPHSLAEWHITPRPSHRQVVEEVLATANEQHPHLRGHIARALSQASWTLLADKRVLWMLARLANDPDPSVRADAAWFPIQPHHQSNALIHYVTLVRYLLRRNNKP